MARSTRTSSKTLLDRAIAAYNAGRFAETEWLCGVAMAGKPASFEILHLLGKAQASLGRANEALAAYDRALAVRPRHAELHRDRALLLQHLNRLGEALDSCEKAIALKPSDALALSHRGAILHQLGRRADALASYDQALALRGDDARTHSNRGVVLQELRRFEEALASYDRALEVQPDFDRALNNRGLVLHELKRFEEALASYQRALDARPRYPEALNNRSSTLRALRRFDEALASCDRALATRPDFAEALNNRGAILWALKRFDDALACYDQALAIRPRYADALTNRGAALRELKRFDEALASYDEALRVRPGWPETLVNRGNVLRELKRFDEALASYDEALAARAELAEALNNRGSTLRDLQRPEEALESYDRALTVRPDYPDALNGRGTVLQDLERFDDARMSHEQAMALRPDDADALIGLATCAVKTCDWPLLGRVFPDVCAQISDGKAAPPLLLFGCSEDQALHLRCARRRVQSRVSSAPPLWRGEIWRNDRIRVAYISADFRMHATSYLVTELFELHDRSRFEVVGISLGPDDGSDMRARVVAAFDHFIDVRMTSDLEAAQLLHDLRIDLAVDMQGHQRGARPGILALRPAPIQACYLGFPGTTGADFIDYIVADPIVLPFDRQPYYTEKIVHLPECYQVNDRRRLIAPLATTREQAGLPSQGFVFCSFNGDWKITPAVFDIWMRLLQAVEGSVLWLLRDNATAEANLRGEAASRGIDPARLVFAERIKMEEHLARHRLADLFLDTFPCNAHTTASDALWAGLPLLTTLGETFSGRVAASLLMAVGLSDLVTRSLAEYEVLALRLAREPDRLRRYRDQLRERRPDQPLFDTDRFRRHIEAAYVHMWERWQEGKPPESFAVKGPDRPFG